VLLTLQVLKADIADNPKHTANRPYSVRQSCRLGFYALLPCIKSIYVNSEIKVVKYYFAGVPAEPARMPPSIFISVPVK